MSKNIIICCDGTDNKLTIGENTNVIHLYSSLIFDANQVGYYSPGVGTIAPSTLNYKLFKSYYVFKDLFSGTSLHSNVMDAYKYLMNTFEIGDKVYLFGFSRGAYTVRMLSGVIEMFGLLQKGNSNHIKYILEVYSRGDKMFETANAFKKKFSKAIDIEFIGVWDTVVSMGSLINWYKSYPYSRKLSIAKVVRHAVAIDERRKHFDYTAVNAEHKNLKEVFFAGVHSDVGGGYQEEGLSKICFNWMIQEAMPHGIRFDMEKLREILVTNPADINLEPHNSLSFLFKMADLIPRPRFKKGETSNSWYFDFRFWITRKIPEGSLIHRSVVEKSSQGNYKPLNLPSQYKIAE